MDKCKVTISYDEYYTNDDFIRRFRAYKELYDVIIFPNMDYEAIKAEIKNNQSNIYKKAENYQKDIRKNYAKNAYQHNIAYFLVEFSTFLYNPQIINLSKTDTIKLIFEKAKSKLVMLLDEPIYMHPLLEINPYQTSIDEAFSKFLTLTKNSKILVNNELNVAYGDPNFAFAYTWPGIAMTAVRNYYKNYQMLLHPKYSLVSADLLAELNNSPATHCVADVMTSKPFLTKMQNNAFYFSPYGDSEQITDTILKEMHTQFFTNLPKLKWFKSISAKEYNALNRAWNYYFRLTLSNISSEKSHNNDP